jgi:hypothetical protein
MKWFKGHSKNVPVAIPASESGLRQDVDARTLARIRNVCAAATESAASASTSPDNLAKVQRQRFESAKRMSLKLAKTIVDASCLDSALHHIIELCMDANDIESPRILVRGIQSSAIREQLLEEHPVIF